VLIADDHVLIREGLKRTLSGASEVNEIGEAESGQQAIDMIRHGMWDVVVLDINLPGKNGLDVLKEVREEKPRLPVLMLSVHPASQYAVRALRAGASGYLTKSGSGPELVNAIRKLAGGGKYISPEVADQLAESLNPPAARPPHTTLSDREFQVLLGLGSGKTVGELAADLSLSVKTVSTYRANILQKLNLKNNAQIMFYAFHHDLIH
jgi:DNA-binding NarL/FixJ family response regulator